MWIVNEGFAGKVNAGQPSFEDPNRASLAIQNTIGKRIAVQQDHNTGISEDRGKHTGRSLILSAIGHLLFVYHHSITNTSHVIYTDGRIMP